jgi:hypothetical protein
LKTVVPNRGPHTYTPSFQPAEKAVLDRGARSSVQAPQAVGVSPSASQTPMAVLVDLVGEEVSARKVWTNSPSMATSLAQTLHSDLYNKPSTVF